MTRAERIAQVVQRIQAPGLSLYALRRIEDTLGLRSSLSDYSEDTGEPHKRAK